MDHDIHSSLAHRHGDGVLEEIRYILLLLLHIFLLPSLLVISVKKLAQDPRILSLRLLRSDVNHFGGLNDDKSGIRIGFGGRLLQMGEAWLVNCWIRLENLGWNPMSSGTLSSR